MKVLLVVIDAASPRVVCPAIQTGALPNLKRLTDAGEMHQSCTSIFPSITPAATTSIITGTYPAEHGVAGASFFDEATQEIAYYGDDFWVIAREGFGAFLRDFLVRLNGDRLKVPTLFELVERQGRTAGCLNYLIYRGLVQHKVNVPWLLALLPGVPITETVNGPSLLWLGDFVTDKKRRRRRRSKKGLLHRFGMDDAGTAELLLNLASAGTFPDFTVAYFADNDYRSHEVGPHRALPVVHRVDRALGALFDAAGGFDRFIQDTCVIVTSDHGHSEILPNAEQAVIPLASMLSEFREAELGRRWRDQDEILICPNMRAAQIYLHHPSESLAERVAATALLDERVDATMWRREASGSSPTRYVVVTPRGRLEFWRSDHETGGHDAYGTWWEWRGDLEALQIARDGRALDSTEYPNALERIAGGLDAELSGEIWMTARPGCEFEVPGGEAHVGGGSHGALHALDSLTPVIVANAGRALPRALRSVDLAPLCLETLGLHTRYRVGDPRGSVSRQQPVR